MNIIKALTPNGRETSLRMSILTRKIFIPIVVVFVSLCILNTYDADDLYILSNTEIINPQDNADSDVIKVPLKMGAVLAAHPEGLLLVVFLVVSLHNAFTSCLRLPILSFSPQHERAPPKILI